MTATLKVSLLTSPPGYGHRVVRRTESLLINHGVVQHEIDEAVEIAGIDLIHLFIGPFGGTDILDAVDYGRRPRFHLLLELERNRQLAIYHESEEHYHNSEHNLDNFFHLYIFNF